MLSFPFIGLFLFLDLWPFPLSCTKRTISIALFRNIKAHHFSKRGGLTSLNQFNTATLLKCLYQARKVSGQVMLCMGYHGCFVSDECYMCARGINFACFCDFSIRFLELFRQCGTFRFFSTIFYSLLYEKQ